jgi:hypothetical protein
MNKELKKVIPFNGVSFYPESFVGFTEGEFMAHEAHHGLTESQLKDAWALVSQNIPDAAEKAKPYVPPVSFSDLRKSNPAHAVAEKLVTDGKSAVADKPAEKK